MEEQRDEMFISEPMNINNMMNTANDDLESNAEISEVAEFFDGLNILVTGGSGFVGKLLIEKLLRGCPKINKLYIMIRAKKGKSPAERFQGYFDEVLYDQLKEENPNFINHVELIEGDTEASDLGLSVKNYEKLKKTVNVVYHAAATVRFNETLRQVVNINVRGTKLMTLFAKEMTNLKVFVYISTAFAYCIYKNLEEKFYEAPIDPDKVLSLVEMLDDDILEHMTPKLIGKWPNTYAFSKAMGEEVVRKYSTGMPTCIVRPSIMVGTYKDPLRGWTNNIYGATGIVVGAGMGLLHTMHCDKDKIADIIPADFVINNIIVASWHVGKRSAEQKQIADETKESEMKIEPIIYNSVSSCQMPITWSTFMHLNEFYGRNYPSSLVIWHYSFLPVKNIYIHNIYCVLLHTIPGAIMDGLAILTGRKPMLLKAYKKIHKLGVVTSYFATQQWTFKNDNVLQLWKETSVVDRKKFDFNLINLNWDEFFRYHVRGLRIYLLKDPLETIESGRRKFKKLFIMHYTLIAVFWLLIAWAVFSFLQFLQS